MAVLRAASNTTRRPGRARNLGEHAERTDRRRAIDRPGPARIHMRGGVHTAGGRRAGAIRSGVAGEVRSHDIIPLESGATRPATDLSGGAERHADHYNPTAECCQDALPVAPGRRDRSWHPAVRAPAMPAFRVPPGVVLAPSANEVLGRGAGSWSLARWCCRGWFGGGWRWSRRTWRWVGLDLAVCGGAGRGGRRRVAGRRTGPQRSRRGLGTGCRAAEWPGGLRLGREAARSGRWGVWRGAGARGDLCGPVCATRAPEPSTSIPGAGCKITANPPSRTT